MTIQERVRAYAEERGIRIGEAQDQLMALGLASQVARAAGGKSAAAGRSSTERSEVARHAAVARWARVKKVEKKARKTRKAKAKEAGA